MVSLAESTHGAEVAVVEDVVAVAVVEAAGDPIAGLVDRQSVVASFTRTANVLTSFVPDVERRATYSGYALLLRTILSRAL